MKSYNTDYLLKYLDGQLPDAEQQLFEKELAGNALLQANLEQLQQTRSVLQDAVDHTAGQALDPFFTDRLMKQLTPEVKSAGSLEDDLVKMLSMLFRPVAIAGLFLAIVLAAYNVNLSSSYTSDTSTAESILAMPPVTLMSVYDMDSYANQFEDLP